MALVGIPRADLQALFQLARTRSSPGERRASTIESSVTYVRNDTGAPLATGDIVQPGEIITAANDERWEVNIVRSALAPAQGRPWAVVMEPMAIGAVGMARLHGRARVKLSVTSATLARCAVIPGATEALQTHAAGDGLVLWKSGDAGLVDADVLWYYGQGGDTSIIVGKVISVSPDGTCEVAIITLKADLSARPNFEVSDTTFTAAYLME